MIEKIIKWNLQLFADAGSVVNTSVAYVNNSTGNQTQFSGNNTLSPEMKDYYDTTLLENYRVKKIFAQFGRRVTLPKRHGKNVEFRKFNTFATASLLTEGATPTGQKMGVTTINAPISQYGTYVSISDVLELRAYDDIIQAATVEMAASMVQSEEKLIRNGLLAGTNVVYCDNIDPVTKEVFSTPTSCAEMQADTATEIASVSMISTGLSATVNAETFGTAVSRVSGRYQFSYNGSAWSLPGVGTVNLANYGITLTGTPTASSYVYINYSASGLMSMLTPSIIAKVVTHLKKNLAPPAAGNYFVAVIHPSVAHDLRNCPEWIDLHKYDASREIFSGEIGELHGVRFIEDPYAPVLGKAALNPANDDEYVNANRSRTYATYFFGLDAFAVIDPEGDSPGDNAGMIVHDKHDIGGPLDQFSTIGYKFETNGATILYPERIVRVMSCSSYSALDSVN